MPSYSFKLNGKTVQVDAPADFATLWVLRDKLGVRGPEVRLWDRRVQGLHESPRRGLVQPVRDAGLRVRRP